MMLNSSRGIKYDDPKLGGTLVPLKNGSAKLPSRS